ncbi:hypothetical protein [Erythrobacter rubeus]|uniref:DUF4386 family protein n=1 Tax=Erythrobacter rubeus TaxID=2760803 RepID=A0ABR8KXM2_9SPHN|nr:hypothetical protein [Erythrobacter rubeus]MBD2842911.1 hypothetical protein [Erythrobacter rubeus]
MLSAVTTVLLWWLPQNYSSPASFEAGVALAANPAYLARLWVNFLHVFIALVAYGGLAAVLARRAPALAWTGLVAMAFWAFAEALGLSINIWAQNGAWRSGYAAADPATRDLIRNAVFVYQGIWNGVFFVVLVCFALGSSALGLACWAPALSDRILSTLLLLAVPLTLVITVDGYFGARLGIWIDWSYPILQPVSHTAMAAWLWHAAVNPGLDGRQLV